MDLPDSDQPPIHPPRRQLEFFMEGIDPVEDFDQFMARVALHAKSKSKIFIGPIPDGDDVDKFFLICSENMVNDIIERLKRVDSLRPRSLENAAVTMAIQQHGLRQSMTNEYGERDRIRTPRIDVNTPTTSGNGLNVVSREGESEWNRSVVQDSVHNDSFDVDDISFLNEAVTVAIDQKGLCCSPFSVN